MDHYLHLHSQRLHCHRDRQFEFSFHHFYKQFHFSYGFYLYQLVPREIHLMLPRLFDQFDNSKRPIIDYSILRLINQTFGFSRCVFTASLANGIHSIRQPYAIGVNLITVWSGTFVYGRSSERKWWTMRSFELMLVTNRHLCWGNKQEYNVQQLDDKQQEHFLHVLIP